MWADLQTSVFCRFAVEVMVLGPVGLVFLHKITFPERFLRSSLLRYVSCVTVVSVLSLKALMQQVNISDWVKLVKLRCKYFTECGFPNSVKAVSVTRLTSPMFEFIFCPNHWNVFQLLCLCTLCFTYKCFSTSLLWLMLLHWPADSLSSSSVQTGVKLVLMKDTRLIWGELFSFSFKVVTLKT